jgi:acyl-CoA synthetase (AMP-forming)/AMP-acid ligase II
MALITFGQQLHRLAEAAPDRPAVTCAAVTITRAELVAAGDDLAVYLRDRAADMILSGGANIYPAEADEGSLDLDELRTFLGERLVSYKVPRTFEFVSSPLRDDAGKVRRSALRAERIAAVEGR